ncbi:hypothetical protein [Roseateles amylovorans]|uniref:Collagen-like protein n=1 Tax=Roseateles amylovorans TaxID=2978473 RepID=A0ABY6AW65_9BURK|nr:hypothetical protein [Roseateles amylovorans]UXH77232.1 hypothetical protein N4261_19775 [Roseateles amylovorans]
MLMTLWRTALVAPHDATTPVAITLRLLPLATAPARRETPAPSMAPRLPPPATSARLILQPLPTLPVPVLPPPALAVPPETAAPIQAPSSHGAVGLDGASVASPGAAASGVGRSGPTGSTGPSGSTGLALAPSREVMRGALSNPAVNDPRANTPKPTFEEKIAMGLDPGLCLKTERLPDGTIRRTLSRWVEAQSTLSATYGSKTAPIRVCR